jgi:DNA-binding CsgD family transcriptional regulator/sugar-specific transcriptional regulator TrmB
MSDEPLPLNLSPGAVTVYLRALRDGGFRWDEAAAATGLGKDELARCRDELVASRLLQFSGGDDGILVPVNPEIAAARVAEPLEERIRTYREAVDTTREQLLALLPAYMSRTVTGAAEAGLEIVSDPAEVQRLVNHAVAKCSKEMLTVQPGGSRDPVLLQAALPTELDALNRGVLFRALYQHTTRTQLSMRSHVATIVKAGAQVRTADQLAERMFIFDREVAFIPKRTNPDQAPGAVVVREPVLLSFLCALFDQFWVSAVPFITDGPGYQNVSDDLRRAMLGLLAQGLKDEVVARRLGMSVRTCRRHIASLMQELGAESRFEAGVRAAQLGLLSLDGHN